MLEPPLTAVVHDPDLTRAREVEREVVQCALGEAVLRFERYPRLDVLLEVEGLVDAPEAAMTATGIPRAAFTAGRPVDFVADFVADFGRRTGPRAARGARQLDGDGPRVARDG